MERHFTATVYIIENHKALLIYHQKYQKWLPPGGHLEANELPSEGARREVREETGLEIEFVTQENVWIDRWNAKSFERPYMCLLEEIPSHNGKPAHQHMDLIYVARPLSTYLPIKSAESFEQRWFSWQELQQLVPDQQIFVETLQTLEKLLEA